MEQNETLNAANALVGDEAKRLAAHFQQRDNKHYRARGLTSEEFCSRHAGVDYRTGETW